jgi:DNA-binding CsgD family transcriptional regulator
MQKRHPDRRGNHDRRAGHIELTPRQRELLTLVLQGEPNKVIAARLGVAEQSAKQSVSELLRKFGVPNRAALADAGARLEIIGAAIEPSWAPQLFRGASVQIAVTHGPEHRYVVVNAAFAKAVGRDVVGTTMREAFPLLAQGANIDAADRVYRTGKSVVGHEVASTWDRGAGPERTYIDAVVQALRGEDGEINGLVYFGIDVTKFMRSRRGSSKGEG